MVWRPVRMVFTGDYEEARSLHGKRVRALAAVSLPVYERSLSEGSHSAVSPPLFPVTIGMEGFVGYLHPDQRGVLTLAFARSGPLPTSVDKLLRGGGARAVALTFDSFRRNFSIDV